MPSGISPHSKWRGIVLRTHLEITFFGYIKKRFTMILMLQQLRQILLEKGVFGDLATGLNACLGKAFEQFKAWRRENKIPCSQRVFRERHLLKASHGYYFTAKAHNGRVVMEWLGFLCRRLAADSPDDDWKLQLHARALLLD